MSASFVRRTVSLKPDVDENIRRIVHVYRVPFSAIIRILFETPISAEDTIEMVRKRFRARVEEERLARSH